MWPGKRVEPDAIVAARMPPDGLALRSVEQDMAREVSIRIEPGIENDRTAAPAPPAPIRLPRGATHVTGEKKIRLIGKRGGTLLQDRAWSRADRVSRRRLVPDDQPRASRLPPPAVRLFKPALVLTPPRQRGDRDFAMAARAGLRLQPMPSRSKEILIPLARVKPRSLTADPPCGKLGGLALRVDIAEPWVHEVTGDTNRVDTRRATDQPFVPMLFSQQIAGQEQSHFQYR